jgi:hypothetical protein
MHPDTISALASLHQRDLDIEASRASLAKSVVKQPATGHGQRVAAAPGRLRAMFADRAHRLRGRSVVSQIPAAIGHSEIQNGSPEARA